MISDIMSKSYATFLPKQQLISICILTWNRSTFLEMCFDNLLGKLYYTNNVEITIMCDGENNQTDKVLEKYKENSRIRVVRNKTHIGLNAYKKLFRMLKGDYIIVIDDDVLELPSHFDKTMVEYLNLYPDYGFLALNVIQNEFTNGAKPDESHYKDDVRHDGIVQEGPAGGWCSCFRRRDYRKIRSIFNFNTLSMKQSQDGVLSGLFGKYLKLKRGIIKNAICFHASGPYYAKKFGYLKTEIEKYQSSNLPSFVEHYKTFLDK